MLLSLFGEIFLIQQHQHRWSRSQVTDHGTVQFSCQLGPIGRIARKLRGQKSVTNQGMQQACLVCAPLLNLLPVLTAIRQHSGRTPCLDIPSRPESSQRRQVVRRRGYQRLPYIILNTFGLTVRSPFKVKQPVAENAEAVHAFAQRRWHSSQILSHHQELAARTFQCQDSQQVDPLLVDVGSVLRRKAVRNPEQPKKPHEMVNS